MAMKTLINRTGNPLQVTLIVRKGDHPDQTAGTVDVELGARPIAAAATGSDGEAQDDTSVQEVTYGDDVDIYLNGLKATMIENGSGIGRRDVVIDRGSPLDNELNTHDTIEFLFDGKALLISATNSNRMVFSFPAA